MTSPRRSWSGGRPESPDDAANPKAAPPPCLSGIGRLARSPGASPGRGGKGNACCGM